VKRCPEKYEKILDKIFIEKSPSYQSIFK